MSYLLPSTTMSKKKKSFREQLIGKRLSVGTVLAALCELAEIKGKYPQPKPKRFTLLKIGGAGLAAITIYLNFVSPAAPEASMQNAAPQPPATSTGGLLN